jgi:hypothetical protein
MMRLLSNSPVEMPIVSKLPMANRPVAYQMSSYVGTAMPDVRWNLVMPITLLWMA